MQSYATHRLSEGNTLRLVELYRREECLWNTKCPDFKNRVKKAAAANRVARQLNLRYFDGKLVMRKFRNLRDTYRHELKKIAASMEPDSPRVYQPTVRWFKTVDSFLRPHLKAARGDEDEEYDDASKDSNDSAMTVKLVRVESAVGSAAAAWRARVPDTVLLDGSSGDEAPPPPQPKRLAKRPRLQPAPEPAAHEAVPEDIRQVLCSHEDPFACFGKYIASLLRNMSPRAALALQPRVVQLVTEAALSDCGGHSGLSSALAGAHDSATNLAGAQYSVPNLAGAQYSVPNLAGAQYSVPNLAEALIHNPAILDKSVIKTETN